MSNAVRRVLAVAVAASLAGCAGSEGPAGPAGASVTVTAEPAGANCALGGVAVTVGGGAPTYVCNGAAGASVDVAAEPPGANCPDGGYAVASGGGAPVFVCNGADGAAGAAPTITGEPAGANCPDGGLAVQSAGTTSYVCNGADGLSAVLGDAGANCPGGGISIQVGTGGTPSYVCNGADGLPAIVTSAGAACAFGGIAVQIGSSGTPSYVCNGAPGADGQSVVIGDAGASCPAGGISVQVGTSGVASYVCNGAPGADGTTPTITSEPAGANCPAGGVKIQLGGATPQYVCNGTSVVVDPCVAQLYLPVKDAWGNTWDGNERGMATFTAAKAACEAIGGRLPIPTELRRVSAVGTGGIGETYDTNFLWSLAPVSAVNQVDVRLSDGATNYTAVAGSLTYRCVCPAATPTFFDEQACNGPPGAACAPLAGHYRIDAADRAALPKSSAVWECAFARGHLADSMQLMEGIAGGLANGSATWLHTADDASYAGDALIKWAGSESAWAADGSNVSAGAFTDLRPFRCVGLDHAAAPFPTAIANEFVGATSVYKGEGLDASPAAWTAAHDTCWSRGGHLPRATELGELVQQGLPAGTNAWLWTSDQTGYDGTQFTAAALRWTGVDARFAYAYSASNTWLYKTDASHPYRCIYYPVDADYAGPDAVTQCNGGCAELTVGPGPAKIWLDGYDRTAATFGNAFRACLGAGGHLASERDLTEAIRAGLPNGSGTATWLHAADLEGAAHDGMIHWTGTEPGYTDLFSAYATWSLLTDPRPYRCVWTNELR